MGLEVAFRTAHPLPLTYRVVVSRSCIVPAVLLPKFGRSRVQCGGGLWIAWWFAYGSYEERSPPCIRMGRSSLLALFHRSIATASGWPHPAGFCQIPRRLYFRSLAPRGPGRKMHANAPPIPLIDGICKVLEPDPDGFCLLIEQQHDRLHWRWDN